MNRGGEASRALVQCREALALLRRVPGVRFGTPSDDATIERAEQALGTAIPPSLRHFIREVGSCDANRHEVFGLNANQFNPAMGSNIVGATLNARRWGLPESCIVVETDPDGVKYVVDTAEVTSCVRRWFKGAEWVEEETHASFGEYLLDVASDHDGTLLDEEPASEGT